MEHLLFQPLDQNTGPVDRPTPTVDPKPLDIGSNPWVSRLCSYLSLSAFLSLIAFLKVTINGFFASKVLINKKQN